MKLRDYEPTRQDNLKDVPEIVSVGGKRIVVKKINGWWFKLTEDSAWAVHIATDGGTIVISGFTADDLDSIDRRLFRAFGYDPAQLGHRFSYMDEEVKDERKELQ